jgi:hypothetical protein
MKEDNKSLPAIFYLGAVEWRIEINNSRLNDLKAYGYCEYDQSLISIANKTETYDRTPQAIEATLYHEVVHAILDTIGKNELSRDEEFVQCFSTLLHQFEKTKM